MVNTGHSWCYKVFITSSLLLGVALGLEYHFAILPIHGACLFTYLFAITTITAWITSVYLQKLLQTNKPFKYKESTVFKRIFELHKSVEAPRHTHSTLPLDKRIDNFVSDIEKRFILKWYTYVTDDPTFPNECKALLDEVVRHFLQVVVDVDAKKLVYSEIIVILKHVKEFRRTLRRSTKNSTAVEEQYRYSHVASNSDKSFQYFIHQLTANVMRQFINWELWNSLPCKTLVSILSRKLTRYLLTYLSSPGFLNYQIVKICASESTKSNLKLNNYSFVSISDVDHSGHVQVEQVNYVKSVSVSNKRLVTLKLEEDCTPQASPKKLATTGVAQKRQTDEIDSSNKLLDSSTVNVKAETKPVKIHESKSSTETWRNSSDLECISLGQDLLAFQDFTNPNLQIQDLIDKKLWKDNTSDDAWDVPEAWCVEEGSSLEPQDGQQLSPTSQIHTYLKSNATTAAIITNTMKPLGNVTAHTLHNMKEIQQSTVNTVSNVVKPVSQVTSNAMHKIGDLQDEAAVVVEGILDFGMAGLRKGLRLTGLQENLSELTQKAKHEFHTHKLEAQKTIDLQRPICIGKITEAIKILDKDASRWDFNGTQRSAAKLIKAPHISEEKVERPTYSSSESDDSVWVNPLNTSSSPSFEGDILLEKTPDALPKSALLYQAFDVPQITTEGTVEASPDLEYEEAQDFASTIAKLRCLLQQRSSESTPSLSPMPQEELSKTPADPPPNDLTKPDGAMPSLYKLCARTATGVFQNTLNTIKTALPGNINESNQSFGNYSNDDWTFVETDSLSDDFSSRIKRLLSERRAFCTVDTAYEAIDSLESADKTDSAWTVPTFHFDDDMDEFDLQVPVTKALFDIICELVSDSNTYLHRESVVKTVLLLIGNYVEDFIDGKSQSLLHLANASIGQLPDNAEHNVLALKLDDMVNICKEKFPAPAKMFLGNDTVEIGIRTFISSLQSQKINQDVFMQMFELLALHVMNACGKVSPDFSA